MNLICIKCKESKSADLFSPDRRHTSGKQSICRKCQNERNKQYRKSNPEISKKNTEYTTRRRHNLGIVTPKEYAIKTSIWLNDCVGKETITHILSCERVERKKGHSLVCNKSNRILVYCRCLYAHIKRKQYKNTEHIYIRNTWEFYFRSKNCNAEYVVLIGFDDRDKLNISHIWCIPFDEIAEKKTITITNSKKSINNWAKYERTNQYSQLIGSKLMTYIRKPMGAL